MTNPNSNYNFFKASNEKINTYSFKKIIFLSLGFPFVLGSSLSFINYLIDPIIVYNRTVYEKKAQTDLENFEVGLEVIKNISDDEIKSIISYYQNNLNHYNSKLDFLETHCYAYKNSNQLLIFISDRKETLTNLQQNQANILNTVLNIISLSKTNPSKISHDNINLVYQALNQAKFKIPIINEDFDNDLNSIIYYKDTDWMNYINKNKILEKYSKFKNTYFDSTIIVPQLPLIPQYDNKANNKEQQNLSKTISIR